VVLRGVLHIILDRSATKLKNGIGRHRHDDNQTVLLPYLDLFDAFEKLLGHEHALICNFRFHKSLLAAIIGNKLALRAAEAPA
jgi:hypothetical protein